METRILRLAVLFGLILASEKAWSQTLVPRPDPRYTVGVDHNSHRWALLVGVQRYSREPEVPFAEDDVELIRNTLVTSGDFNIDNILVLSDGQKQRHHQPTLDNMNVQIPRWLGNIGREDSLIVYFAGHGHVDDAGTGYLCPVEFDRSNPKNTGFSLARMQELLVGCPAREKVLVLDCCHASAARAISLRAKINGEKLIAPFQKTSGLVTLASCDVDELSYEDKSGGHGVFTAQVAKALRGGADFNRDSVVDTEELFAFCSERVPALVHKQHNADQHPKRFPEGAKAVGIARTQFSPSVEQLVARKENGVFRIECLTDQIWAVRGTAFAIANTRGKLYLVTAASTVEDDEGRLRSKERFRLLLGRRASHLVQPNRIMVHRDRRNSQGPDVAIMEITWGPNNITPTMFNLRPSAEAIDLRGRECAFLAFPNGQKVDSFEGPEYSSGKIMPDRNSYRDRFAYQSDYPNQADGAPLFVVDDQSERGGQLRESVIGVTLSSRYGDNQRFAESTDIVWQIISDSIPQIGFSILPIQKSRDDLKETKLVVPVRPDGEAPASPESVPNVNWPERIDRALKQAVQEGRNHNWDLGIAQLTEIEDQLTRDGAESILPWEFYTLRGVLATRRGLQQNDQGNRTEAVRSFIAAWHYCHRAWKMASNEPYALLMLGRVYNNLGTPNPGQVIGTKELEYLKWTHDQMKSLLDEDKKGVRKLEVKHLAQCQYLLGYVHEIAGKPICGATSGRQDYESSWKLFRSTQVSKKLNQYTTDSVDIWNEFDELLQVWDRRRSTVCTSCQAAKKCESCN